LKYVSLYIFSWDSSKIVFIIYCIGVEKCKKMGNYICKVKASGGNTHMVAKGKRVGWKSNGKSKKGK
jgi:hypothetical protein